MTPTTQPTLAWRDAAAASFQYHKNLADRAVAQVSDKALHRALDPHTNSIAVVMQHIVGNLRSRWTDFLTTDGEKPWRQSRRRVRRRARGASGADGGVGR